MHRLRVHVDPQHAHDPKTEEKFGIALPIETWLRLEQEHGCVRRFAVTLQRDAETSRFGLGLNPRNQVTLVPPGSGLEPADTVIGCDGARLRSGSLEGHLLHCAESAIELEVPRLPSPRIPLRLLLHHLRLLLASPVWYHHLPPVARS